MPDKEESLLNIWHFHIFSLSLQCHPLDGGQSVLPSDKSRVWHYFMRKTFTAFSSDILEPRKFQLCSEDY